MARFRSHGSVNCLACYQISLREGEDALVAADPAFAANPNDANDLSLIRRVIIYKELSINFIRPNALRLLHPVKGATFKTITPNVFVIKFNHALDRMKAMGGCPWVLDRHALIFEPIDPMKKPENQKLTLLPIIARVGQLSLANRSEFG